MSGHNYYFFLNLNSIRIAPESSQRSTAITISQGYHLFPTKTVAVPEDLETSWVKRLKIIIIINSAQGAPSGAFDNTVGDRYRWEKVGGMSRTRPDPMGLGP